ncbi:hypothetical protein PMZ80_000572 [Knufia obscura]|uniref:GST N-terminal domain-containing protein n=1 Tax=Knufia obscura TaxID=1635080 RepID=A0ABR0S1R3_9EURO|nr:hypothetical protein PMZ80_000572 [Knufia obscura]
MNVDPRLQLSDLTDYQFQASLAQQYGSYNTTGLQHAVNSRYGQNPPYFQPIPRNEARTSDLRSSQQFNHEASPPRGQARSAERNQGATGYQHTVPRLYGSHSSGGSPALDASTNTIHANSSGNRNSIPVNRTNSTRSILANARSNGSPQQNSRSSTSSPANRPQQSNANVKDPTTYTAPHLLAPMKPNPPSLREWRNKFFNIDEPLLLTEDQYLTYFPHVDNVYSHRSTQKYKRKPFVSHYWDCRLKGRPTGTPLNKKKLNENGDEQERKKRKRKVRERDLCDVKIKVTEFFGTEELEALRKLGLGPEVNPGSVNQDSGADLTFVVNGQQQNENNDSTFGILEPNQSYPPGHPGYGGKKWYMVQRVNGNDKEGEDPEDRDLDHKHSLEESDRIKKNSVQRWLLAREKEKKKAAKDDFSNNREDASDDDGLTQTATSISTPASRYHASGIALQTVNTHTTPTANNLTLYGCSFCPFSQRVWIALEAIGIPYQYRELTERDMVIPPNSPPGTEKRPTIPDLAECNPEGKVPCLKHNNFCVWESTVMLEYLEDLAMGQSLFQPAVGNPQLKAHSRLWVDFIDRRILPVFYALLILPDQDTANGQQTNESNSTDVRRDPNFADRNHHATPYQTRYNAIPKPPPTFLPTSKQCDLSTLPPNSRPSYFSHPTTTTSPKAHTLTTALLTNITTLVNASHRTGPYFLGPTLSYVDIAFAPWIIRLNYVLSHYRHFPRPEVGTRWQQWCDAIERDEVVRRTVSEEEGYRDVYGGGINGAGGGASGNLGEGSACGLGWEYDEYGRFDVNKAWETGNGFPEMMWVDRSLYGGMDLRGERLGGAGGVFGYSFDQ